MALNKAAQAIEDEFAAYEERRALRQTEAWMPEPGTTVKGKLVGLRIGGENSEYGVYPVFVYRNLVDGSNFAVHAFHTTIRERYRALAGGVPEALLGQEHFVSYQGVRKSRNRVDKNGQPQEYYLYDVEIVGSQDTQVQEGFAF